MRSGPPAASRRESDLSDIPPLVLGLLLFAIVCTAAGLRFYRLDAQSLWNDEGNSARIAERSLDLIVEGAAGDIHPPGYYLLLHAWRGLFGQSEFALRSLSVVAGLAMVVLTGLLAQQLFGRAVGLMAAALSTLSPFAIYYSQEARMYALLGALAAVSVYVAFRTMEELLAPPHGGRVSIPAGPVSLKARIPERRPVSRILCLVAYALLNAGGLYTHYAFAFVLIAHNVVFGLRWLVASARSEPDWRGLGAWSAAQVGTGLLYLPWVPIALNAAGWSSAGGEYAVGSALLDVARVLVVGVTQSLSDAKVVIAGALALFVLGLWPRVGQPSRDDGSDSGRSETVALALYLVVPLALFFGFDLYKPAWLKFLVVLLPPFHIFVARGMANIAALVSQAWSRSRSQRRTLFSVVSAGLLVALAALLVPSLQNLYFDPAYARDDYRQLAADIRAMWRPGDAIVLNAPNQWEVFTYYHPDQDVYPAPYRPGPGRASAFLDPLLEAYERLFVLYWGDAESDPEKRFESWLADHAYKAGDRWYGDVRLAIYGLAPSPERPDVTLDALFGERIFLRGYALIDGDVAPGDIIPVTLFWEAARDIEDPYKVSVQLLDAEKGQLVSQMDTVPRDGLAPTTSWQRGETLVDRYGISVPTNISSGQYSLIVAVYHATTAERLPVVVQGDSAGDHLVLTTVAVRAER